MTRIARLLFRVMLVLTMGAVLVVAGPGVPPTRQITLAPTTTTIVATTTTITTTTATTTPAEPLALVSPSGVPVAVTGESGSSWTVTTPCGETATLRSGTPVTSVDVMLDPGHGGPIDTGAVGPTGLSEKEINLTLARALEERLFERGISVLLTRTADYPSPLGVRAALADTVQAELFISIHHNGPTPGPSPTPGTEVFIQSDSEDSRRLGGLLYEHITDALGQFEVAWAAAPDAGVMTVVNSRGSDAYGILRNPSTPAALIEIGYISNRAEAELFGTSEYVETATKALADAIEAYLTTDQPGSGFVEGRVFNPPRGVGADVCVDPDLG